MILKLPKRQSPYTTRVVKVFVLSYHENTQSQQSSNQSYNNLRTLCTKQILSSMEHTVDDSDLYFNVAGFAADYVTQSCV